MAERKEGYVISIEGIDGAGKTTLAKSLGNWFANRGITAHYIKFPEYATDSGALVSKILHGEIKADPYLTGAVLSVNKRGQADYVRRLREAGEVVILDRYCFSNLAYQGARYSGPDRDRLTNWLYKLEYGLNNVPQEDAVILLKTPTSIARSQMSERPVLDTYEADQHYQDNVAETYDELCEKYAGEYHTRYTRWIKVETWDQLKFQRRSIEQITESAVLKLMRYIPEHIIYAV